MTLSAPSLLQLLALLSTALLSLSSIPSLVLSQANSSAPAVLFHDPNTALTLRWYSSCAINVHQIGAYSATPYMMQFGGSTTAYSVIPSYDLSLNGGWDNAFTLGGVPTLLYTPTGYAGCNPIGRVAGGGGWLTNGNLVVLGGKSCPNWVEVNDVIYSTNNAQSFAQSCSAAPWSARSDFSLAVAPNTNVIVLAGGTDANGNPNNDVWMSNDGTGMTWSLMTANPGFAQYQEGPMTFLYDAASNGGGVATLVLYNPIANAVYSSTNNGATWSMTANLTLLNLDPNEDARIVAGADNSLFMAGGEGPDTNMILYSQTKGASWYWLNNQNWSPNISNAVAVDDFTYGCLAVRYTPSSTAPYGYHDQLVMFGGVIEVDNLIASGYNCYFDAGSSAITSVVAEIIQPYETYSLPASVPPGGRSPQMVYHDAGQWLTYRLYADCAYDVHQAVRKTPGLSMWQLGGFTSAYSYINSIDFTSTGSWTNLQEWNQPTYTGASSTPSGRVAAGAALLVNGNLLYFAGKDSAAAVYTNDVYVSANNGSSFTYVGLAGFSPRSDFATAVLPMTNTVVVVGGMFDSTGAATGAGMNDVWVSSDGSGAVWTQITSAGPFPPFTDAAFTAMYDGAAVNASYTQTYSTLILYTGGYEDIFYSTNLGSTWTTSAAPWSFRLHGMFVADADNYVYFTGGADDGNLWYSWNKGSSWVNVNTAGNGYGNNYNNAALRPSSIYLNLFQYIGITSGTGNCMAMRYTANSASPNGYHKTVVLYGGANTIGVASRPAASCVQQEAANVLYAEVMFPSELSNSAWTDTALPVTPANTVPSVVFNSPTVLMTYRQYPTCAYDVHSLVNHPSAPAQFVLGGWDANSNVLATYDFVNGSSFSTAAYVASWGQNNNPPPGRIAGGAAYLANGVLVWFGGKTSAETSANVLTNDVWYEARPTNYNGVWTLATAFAPWFARSDMSVAAMPGTNCMLMVGGTQVSGAAFNDVWASCDGMGAVWTVQSAAAPWSPIQQGAFVALYDGQATGGSQANATVLYYPAYNQLVYSSVDGGKTWKALGVAPWTYRTTARFVSDAESNVYLIGGENFGSIAGDNTNTLGTQSLNDVWYSNNKGVTWYQMQTSSNNNAYGTVVQPSSLSYTCAFINYAASSSGANGYHRQLTVLSGQQQVYSTSLQFGGSTTYSSTTFSYSQCVCDAISGVRAVVADLIFPGEIVTAASSSGSSSKSYSPGATAGIAIGVAVGTAVLTALAFLLLGGALGRASRSSGKSSSGGSKRFEDETGGVEPSQTDVEMHTAQPSSP